MEEGASRGVENVIETKTVKCWLRIIWVRVDLKDGKRLQMQLKLIPNPCWKQVCQRGWNFVVDTCLRFLQKYLPSISLTLLPFLQSAMLNLNSSTQFLHPFC